MSEFTTLALAEVELGCCLFACVAIGYPYLLAMHLLSTLRSRNNDLHMQLEKSQSQQVDFRTTWLLIASICMIRSFRLHLHSEQRRNALEVLAHEAQRRCLCDARRMNAYASSVSSTCPALAPPLLSVPRPLPGSLRTITVADADAIVRALIK
eukprot:392859-Pleurochrysis_carterae.AAC.3